MSAPLSPQAHISLQEEARLLNALTERLTSALTPLIKRSQARPFKIAVACSGGADSMALTEALLAVTPHLMEQLNVQLTPVVLSVSHGLHERSEEHAQGLKLYWEGRGVSVLLAQASTALIAAGRGVEEGARRARYEAFEQARRAHQLSLILLAHHADDQAETLLMRLQGPTGPLGLGGIPSARGALLRPWLSLRGALLKSFAHAKGLPIFEDPTNDDERLLRNKLRRRALPGLRESFGEAWVERAHQSAAQARLLWEGARGLVAELLKAHAVMNARRVELTWAEGLSLPTSTQRLVLYELWRCALAHLTPQAQDPRRLQEHLEPLWRLWSGQALSQHQLPYELWAWGRGGALTIALLSELEPLKAQSERPTQLLSAPAQRLLWGDHALTARLSAVGTRHPHSIPLSRAPLPWRLRLPHQAERFHPLGAPGSKPLKQLWSAARCAPVERERLPVLVDGEDRVIWAPYLRPAEHVRGGAGERWELSFDAQEPLTPLMLERSEEERTAGEER